MIREVWFRNFKAYRSLNMELEPFTVLVGPNASGKTTLLEGLLHISRFAGLMDKPAGSRDLPPSLRSFGISGNVELGISGSWKGTEGAATVIGGQEETTAEGEAAWLRCSIVGQWNGKQFPANLPEGFTPPLREFREALSSTAVLRFNPRNLAGASYSHEAVPWVHPDGSGLASVLAYLKLSQDEVFDQIEQALRQVVPSVKRIRIERAIVEPPTSWEIWVQTAQPSPDPKLWGHRVVLDMRGAKGVQADAAGEGTLMVLGLLTVLMGPTKPRLVLLDDVELALHPVAQAKLIEVLRVIRQRDPELQIVATSHSPFILNYLDAKEVRMTFLAENGFARCEKLTAHPEFEKWKDLISPGEFWSTVGENWLDKAGETSVSK
jgi:predicted ATPase